MSDPLFFENNSSSNSRLKHKLASLNPYIIGILSLGTLLIIVLSIWAFYPSDDVEPESLPVIYADKTPIRVKPEETDITVATDYNSRIYDTFGQTDNSKKIENLLKAEDLTEDPMPREELFAGINPKIGPQQKSKVISITENGNLPADETAPSEEQLEEVQETKIETITVTSNLPSTIDEKNKIAIDVPTEPKRAIPGIFDSQNPSATEQDISEADAQEAEKTEPAAGATNIPEPVTPAPAYEAGNYYVQLASIQDKSRTEESWKKLIEKHNSLQKVSYRTQTADIEGKGTFYRIQAGPLSKSSANDLCNSIKSQGGSCFVTAK